MKDKIQAKRGKIASYQMFFVIFVSRVVVTLTYVQTVSVGSLGSDFLFSIALSCIFTLIISILEYLCIIKNKYTFISWIYSIYFVWLSALNVSRFAYFVSSRVNTNSSMVFFIVLIAIAGCYCAVMGIEGISRFGAFCGVLLVITVLIVLVFNIHNFKAINFYPIFINSRQDILKNAVVMTSNSAEPAMFWVLANRVNGNKTKPLFFGITASYLIAFLLILFVIAVMGAGASLQSFPIFTMFQMASIGSFSRLDMLHTAYWVLALLLKTSLLIYSASVTIKKYKHTNKCVFFAIIIGVTSIMINVVLSTSMVKITKYISVVAFVIFVISLPLISLIFKRKGNTNNSYDNNGKLRKSGDVIENF